MALLFKKYNFEKSRYQYTTPTRRTTDVCSCCGADFYPNDLQIPQTCNPGIIFSSQKVEECNDDKYQRVNLDTKGGSFSISLRKTWQT